MSENTDNDVGGRWLSAYMDGALMHDQEVRGSEDQRREDRIEELRIALERVMKSRDDNPVVPWPTRPPWAK